MASMMVLKIIVSALTASFRVPHVMIGRLPTFKTPPPATLYGYLAGALGKWFNPNNLRFGYSFTYEGVAEDLESAHIVEYSSGYLWKNGPIKNLEGQVNPQRREFLFRPRMELYLDGDRELLEKIKDAVLRPQFAALLGRSQDLATCHSAEWTDLENGREGFFANTILPWSMRTWTTRGIPVLMPKSVNYSYYREPLFERFLDIDEKPLFIYEGSPDIIGMEGFQTLNLDKSATRKKNGRTFSRAVILQPFEIEGVET